jgi:hypothetical protein
LRIPPVSAALTQYADSILPVDQLASFSLGESSRNLRGDFVAMISHPIFIFELLTKDVEDLIEDFLAVVVRAGLEGQLDCALMFWLKFDSHRPASPCSIFA